MTFRLELDDDDESWLQVMMYATELSSAFLHLPKAARQSFFRDFISITKEVIEQQVTNNNCLQENKGIIITGKDQGDSREAQGGE